MKQKMNSAPLLLLVVFLLITTPHTCSRKLLSNQEMGIQKSVSEMDNIESFTNLMGVEECGSEDEECLKRRVLADAHLDYIYTQHHEP